MEPNCVYAYGFGDAVSQDISVFNLLEDEDSPCLDFKQGDQQFFAFKQGDQQFFAFKQGDQQFFCI